MILAAESQHPGSPEDQAKAVAQLMDDLKEGMKDPKYGATIESKLMSDADQLLKKKLPGEAPDPHRAQEAAR